MKPCLRVQFPPRPVLVVGIDIPSLLVRAAVITGIALGALVPRLVMAYEMKVFPRDPARAIDRSERVVSSADGRVVYAADVADGTVRSRSRSAPRSVFEMKHDPPQTRVSSIRHRRSLGISRSASWSAGRWTGDAVWR